MNSIFLTSRFSLLVIILLAGCALQQEQIKGHDSKSDRVFEQQTDDSRESAARMQITYGNKSSKMSLLLDVNSQDVNIKMSGGAANSGEQNVPQLEKTVAEPQETAGTREARQKKSETPSEENEWNEVMDIAKNSDLSNKNLQQVLAEIRKSQEFFYQKRYPEALDMVKFSLEKQETAEGYALMGSILYMMDNKNGARESWIQSIRLNPDMPAVNHMLKKLKMQ